MSMNIAVFNPYTPDMLFGGYEYGSYESARNLAARGHKVDFICLSDGKKTENISKNFRVIHCGSRIKTSIPQADYFSDVLSNFFLNHAAINRDYDVLFSFNGTFFGGLSKIPTVMYSYGLLPFSLSPITFACTGINWFNAIISKKIIAVTNYAAKQFEAHKSLAGKITVVPTGVYTDYFRPGIKAAKIAEKYNPDNHFTITYIGRITRDKCGDLIEIARLIVNEKRKVKFFIVGKGTDNYMKHLRGEVLKHGLQDNIVFFGPVERRMLPLILNNTDLFVMASSVDTFGLVNVEAQACGVPVIAYDVAGVGESFVNGKSGFLVGQRNIEEFASKVIYLMDNEKYRRAMGRFGRSWVQKNLSWPVIAKRIEAVLKEVSDEN